MRQLVKYSDNISGEYPDYLDDESGIVKGKADRIYFPENELGIIEIIKEAKKSRIPITISGGGTGISGGRVPLKGWIIATDKMRSISDTEHEVWEDPETKIKYQVKLEENEENALLTIPVSMTVKAIQNYCREKKWFYPPDPTERTSFIGGNVATNASGARTFKYGPTREWVQKLGIILPDGRKIEMDRSRNNGTIDKNHIILFVEKDEIKIPCPGYALPDVTKDVSAPIIRDGMHPIDLFIGSGGLFGVITEVTLKLIRQPSAIMNIFAYCMSKRQAYDLIKFCQIQRREKKMPDPLSVEFMDDKCVDIMRTKDSRIPSDVAGIVMIEQDILQDSDYDQIVEFWVATFEEMGIEDSSLASSHKEVEHHKFLRHIIPEYLLDLTKSYNQSALISDFSVPEDQFEELFFSAFEYGKKFEDYQAKDLIDKKMGYLFLAHAGDSHIHLSFVPKTDQEAIIAKDLLLEVLIKVVEMGGSIAAEHGLGKKEFNGKPALYYQYGDQGMQDIKDMKMAIDPLNLLNPNNLIRIT